MRPRRFVRAARGSCCLARCASSSCRPGSWPVSPATLPRHGGLDGAARLDAMRQSPNRQQVRSARHLRRSAHRIADPELELAHSRCRAADHRPAQAPVAVGRRAAPFASASRTARVFWTSAPTRRLTGCSCAPDDPGARTSARRRQARIASTPSPLRVGNAPAARRLPRDLGQGRDVGRDQLGEQHRSAAPLSCASGSARDAAG